MKLKFMMMKVKLISKTEQKTDKNEVNLCDNSEFFYEFTKAQLNQLQSF